MSAEQPAYNSIYLQAWALLSLVVALVLFSMFVFGDTFLHAGKSVWDLIRWLASPVI